MIGALAPELKLDNDKFVSDVLQTMYNDQVSPTVKSDPLLLLLGKTQYSKLGSTRAGQVREKLRILGKLKLILRQITQQTSANIGDFITPQKFANCVTAVKSLASVSDKPSLSGTKTFDKPSMVLKAGQLLKKVAGLKTGHAIQFKDVESKTAAVDFLDLYYNEWKDIVSGIAHQTSSERRYNKELLPLTSDLVKLNASRVT